VLATKHNKHRKELDMPLTKLNYVNGEITPAEPGFYLIQLVYLDAELGHAYFNEDTARFDTWETPVTGWFVSGNTRTPVTSGNEIWLDEDWVFRAPDGHFYTHEGTCLESGEALQEYYKEAQRRLHGGLYWEDESTWEYRPPPKPRRHRMAVLST
jgi:hypothetical protein